jgi:hypothetical protein
VQVIDGDDHVVAITAMTAPGPQMDDERPVGPVGFAPVQGVVWLPGGATQSYRLVVTLDDVNVGDVLVGGTLSGAYTPMAEGEPAQHGQINTASEDAPVSLVPGG